MDDPIFDNITLPQWIFYAEMIYNDKKKEQNSKVAMTEYLASFWNPEAVSKIQESRNSKEKHKFKDDAEFEKEVVSGNYKENKLLEAVKKMRSLDAADSQMLNKNKIRSKLPTDLSSIKSTMEKFK